MFWIVRKIAGNRMARVPLGEVLEIGPVVKLKCTAEQLKLHEVEDKVRAWIPRVGAM
jgi:hypothetical protein